VRSPWEIRLLSIFFSIWLPFSHALADRQDADDFGDLEPPSNVLPFDGTPWNVPQLPPRIVVVGDIHGDINNLVKILKDTNLIRGKRATWKGNRAHLVLMGDLIDRGEDSKAVMMYVQQLTQQARSAGGEVHALIGNHEALAAEGDFRATAAEISSFQKGTKMSKREVLDWTYRSKKGPFADWIASRNAIVQIGPYIFVHAGIGSWAIERDPGEVNSTIRAWMRFLQGNGPKPPSRTSWVVDNEYQSPLWTRALASSSPYLNRALMPGNLLNMILDRWNATHLFVGHSVTQHSGFRITLDHPTFKDRVIEMDTGISYAVGGRSSALIIEKGELKEIYPLKKKTNYWITKRLRSTCVEDIRRLVKKWGQPSN
jgi:hypothetical protein